MHEHKLYTISLYIKFVDKILHTDLDQSVEADNYGSLVSLMFICTTGIQLGHVTIIR